MRKLHSFYMFSYFFSFIILVPRDYSPPPTNHHSTLRPLDSHANSFLPASPRDLTVEWNGWWRSSLWDTVVITRIDIKVLS